jgi:hypothetical protein
VDGEIVEVERVLAEVRGFSAFTADNDPHKAHDFGSFTLAGSKFFGKSTTTTLRWSSVRRTRPTGAK